MDSNKYKKTLYASDVIYDNEEGNCLCTQEVDHPLLPIKAPAAVVDGFLDFVRLTIPFGLVLCKGSLSL